MKPEGLNGDQFFTATFNSNGTEDLSSFNVVNIHYGSAKFKFVWLKIRIFALLVYDEIFCL